MKPNKLWAVCALLLAVGQIGLLAQLSGYAVVSGNVVYDSDPNHHTTKSPHLEPVDNQGRWPHYVFNVDSPAGRCECVINVYARDNNGNARSVNYRIARVNWFNCGYDSTLSLAPGFYRISRDSSSGALDFIRHPGVLRDIKTLPWSWDPNFVVGEDLPAFDSAFANVRHVWAMGEPYDNGLGIHCIHQNQGNLAGADHSSDNGTWQDGAVLLEYDPFTIRFPGFFWRDRFGHWHQTARITLNLPNRKLLMTRFQVQEDFTHTTGQNTPAGWRKPGDGVDVQTLASTAVVANGVTLQAGGSPYTGSIPSAGQFEMSVTVRSGNPVLYVRAGSPPTDSLYDARSARPTGQVEFVRLYNDPASTIFFSIKNAGAGPCCFDVSANRF